MCRIYISLVVLCKQRLSSASAKTGATRDQCQRHSAAATEYFLPATLESKASSAATLNLSDPRAQ
jgi:hypothetical protein